MSFTADPAARQTLVERVKGILLKPSAEWDRIDVERTGVQALFTGYAMILAAIGPVANAIGMSVIGFGVPLVGVIRVSPLWAVCGAVVSYVLNLVGIFVLGLIINALAPNFGGAKNQTQAMKVAVYSSTASWIAAVVGVLPPPLSALAIVGGLYSLYLLYLGLPKLMKAPQDKALGYTALVVVCAIVVAIVAALVTAPMRMMGVAAPGGIAGSSMTIGGPGGTVRVDGGSVAALTASANAMAAQAKAIEAQANGAAASAGAAVVSSDALKAMLPASVAGFARGEVSAEAGGIGGMSASHAKAEYARGDAHMTLEVSDTGGMAALAGLAGALGVNSTKETAAGWERITSRDGRTVSEEYDRTTKHGKYAVVSGRGMVQAEGDNVSIDDLKAAVSAVDPARVSALAKG